MGDHYNKLNPYNPFTEYWEYTLWEARAWGEWMIRQQSPYLAFLRGFSFDPEPNRWYAGAD